MTHYWKSIKGFYCAHVLQTHTMVLDKEIYYINIRHFLYYERQDLQLRNISYKKKKLIVWTLGVTIKCLQYVLIYVRTLFNLLLFLKTYLMLIFLNHFYIIGTRQ